MPVQSIECQLVRAQIGRYLGGEPLSQEAMRQLEVHIVACDDCRAALAVRKSDLRAKMSLEGSAKKQRTQADPVSAGQRAAVDYKAIEAAGAAVGAAGPKAKPNTFTKPLALTAGLAVVLFAMSRMSGGNGFSLGTTALSAFAASAATPSSKSATAKPTPPPAPQASSTTAVPAATPQANAPTTPAPAPTTPTEKPAVSTTPANTAPVAATSQPVAAPTTADTKSPTADSTPKNPQMQPNSTTPAAKPAQAPVKEAPKPAEEPKTPPVEHHATPAAPKHLVHRRVKARKAALRRALALRAKRAHKKAHRGAVARVRVYDASGSPLN